MESCSFKNRQTNTTKLTTTAAFVGGGEEEGQSKNVF